MNLLDKENSHEDSADAPLCTFCGSPLPEGRSRFCSTKCKDAWKHYRMSKAEVEAGRNRTCLWCGKTFTHKFVGVRFCCKACNSNYNNHGKISQAEFEKAASRTCPVCGSVFVAKTPKQVYCSRGCYVSASRSGIGATAAEIRDGGDLYAEILRRKFQEAQDSGEEFEKILSLPAEERRMAVSEWGDAKKKELRAFYMRKYGLSSSGTVYGIPGREKTDEELTVDHIAQNAHAVLERRTFDEDNVGFEEI